MTDHPTRDEAMEALEWLLKSVDNPSTMVWRQRGVREQVATLRAYIEGLEGK